MTIPANTAIKAGPFVCDGVQNAFPFAFKTFVATDIRVILTDANGVESDLVYPTAYAVALNADQNNAPGGTVTTVTTYAVGYKITVVSNIPSSQGLNLTNGGGFFPSNITDALDRIVLLIMQFAEKVGRTLRWPISDTASAADMPTAASRAGKFLAFDLSGNPIAATGVTGAPVSAAMTPVVASLTVGAALGLLGGASTARQVIAGTGLTGGGDLTADRTLTLNMASKNTWTGTQKAGTTALTSGVAADFTAGQHFTANVNGSTFNIANASAQTDGTYIAIDITYTTSNTVSLGTNFKNVAQWTPTATAGKTDTLLFRVRGSNYELQSFVNDSGKA